MASERYYCWRTGGVFLIDFDTEPCPGCGAPSPSKVPDGECGCFAQCGFGHDHSCELPPLHDGQDHVCPKAHAECIAIMQAEAALRREGKLAKESRG